MSDRAALLGDLVALVPVLDRPVLVALDGPDAAGKTALADDLAADLARNGRAVVRSGTDHFHHPRAHRYERGRTGETVWQRSFDCRVIRRELVDPWLAGAGTPYRRTWWHLADDRPDRADPAPVPDDGVLVFDGVFAQRPELVNAWDLVVYVDADTAVRVQRMAERDGTSTDPEHPSVRRYLDAQENYARACRPRDSADLVVDLTDPERPVLSPGLPGGGPPDGWTLAGDHLVRTVRVPRDRAELCDRVDRLLEDS